MILADTSVWVEIFRDRSGRAGRLFKKQVGDEAFGLSRFSQLELLQGAKDEREWNLLEEYLAGQFYLEADEDTWEEAARIYFDMRRQGLTAGSPVGCCIAQVAMSWGALLLHRDRDFEKIAAVRPLKLAWFASR